MYKTEIYINKESWREETKYTTSNETRMRRYTHVHVTTSTYGEHSGSADMEFSL